jgi:UDP-glucose 4-epimerase
VCKNGKKYMKYKKVLVTGGAGFIGSHLCEKLVSLGCRVISLDNYFTGKKENHIKGVKYINGHTKDIKKLVKEKIDIVYHLGEYSRVAKSIEEPELVMDLNLKGITSVLEFCRRDKIKIVYAGSSTKFAKNRPDGIRGIDLSPYTWSKAVNSSLVKNYGEWYKLPFAIVYFYNVYGPRELDGEYGTVVEIFKQKYLKGEALPVRKPGTQKRNYTSVSDTVKGIILAGEKGRGDGYGIGSSKSYSIKEVAKLFNTKIKMLPARKTSRPSAKVNSAKIKKLGWKESEKLEDYIYKITN